MKTTSYDTRFIVRMSKSITQLLESTSRRMMMSQSEYVRKALFNQFKLDQVELPQPE